MNDKELSDLALLDAISDQFESNWSNDSLSLFQSCLKQCKPKLRELLFAELLKIDIELRMDQGKALRAEEYQAIFPEYSQQIELVAGVADSPAETKFISLDKTTGMSDDGIEETTEISTAQRQFGRFEIKQELGRGAFGLVYRAYDPTLDREVALKLPRFPDDDQLLVDRFLSEAQIAAQLQHPHIVAVWERGRIDQQYYLSSSFVPGVTLERSIADSKPDHRQVVVWVRDIAAALDYAHQKRVVHRDIKPANVMINEQNQPMIMDFGLAKRTDHAVDLTREGVIMGTPAYMSPEQARGLASEIGPQTDQYSLGVVFYQLLTGSTPWRGSTMQIVTHLQNNPSPPNFATSGSAVSADLQAICQHMLEPRVADRYLQCQSVVDDLNRYLENRPVSVRPISTLESVIRWSRRNKIVSSLIGAVLLTLFFSLLFVSGAWLNAQVAWQQADSNLIVAKNQERKAKAEERKAKIQEQKAKAERAIAVEQTGKAVQAATAQRKEASRNKILVAGQRIQEGRFYNAEQILQDVPEEDRNWVWNLQNCRIPKAICKIDVGYKQIVSPQVLFDETDSRVAIANHPKLYDSTTETNIFDANTGKLIDKVASESPSVTSSGAGFTKGGRYLIVQTEKSNKSGTVTISAYDTKQKELIGKLDNVWTFTPLTDSEHEVLFMRSSNTESEYLLWNFSTDVVKSLGKGPYCFPYNYSVNSERTELTLRNRNSLTVLNIANGERVSMPTREQLAATDWNMSLDRKFVAGQLKDVWAWRDRGRSVAGGNAAVIELPDKMVSWLETLPVNANTLFEYTRHQGNAGAGKLRGYIFSNNNRYVCLDMQFNQGPTTSTRPFIWWRRDTGEWLGQAQGIAISPTGERFAASEENAVVIRPAPKLLRRFNSPHIENTLASLQPVTPTWQSRPQIFYEREEPWLFIAHNNGANTVNTETKTISMKLATSNFRYFPQHIAIDHAKNRIAFMNGNETVDIYSLKSGERTHQLPCEYRPNNSSLAFHPNGKEFVSGHARGLVVWSINDKKVTQRVPDVKNWNGQKGRLNFSPDGKILAIGGTKGLAIVDTKDWSVRWQVYMGKTAAQASLSHDPQYATIDGQLGEFQIFNTSDGSVAKTIKTDARSVTPCFHPTLPLLFIGRRNGELAIYDTQTWQRVFYEFIASGNIDQFNFSQSGNAVAIGIDMGRNRRWFELRSATECLVGPTKN